ncbi:MAG: helix-turn-helix transcriptional regulator [Clostridia bacterium]|nr:helix-turn-helix transcriptional regulator [Clostridia bacterium]
MKTLGQNIAYYRKEKGLTQEKLAEICDVSPQAVSKWENELACPDIMLLKKLSRTFGISVDELLDDGEEPIARLAENQEKGKLLKICAEDGEDTVKLNLPVALIELLLKSDALHNAITVKGKQDILSAIDFNKAIELVSLGVMGKIIEVRSKDGSLVEVWIE